MPPVMLRIEIDEVDTVAMLIAGESFYGRRPVRTCYLCVGQTSNFRHHCANMTAFDWLTCGDGIEAGGLA